MTPWALLRRMTGRWVGGRAKIDRSAAQLFEEQDYLDAYSAHTDMRVERDPQEAVGGMWETIGQLQFDFLVSKGLQPHHKLLDIGCGTLRGGRFFVKYLDAGNYSGIDISPKAIEYAEELVRREGLGEKKPSLLVSKNKDLTFAEFQDETFDYLLAQSVFTHLDQGDIRKCFEHVSRIMTLQSRFFFTFKEAVDFEQVDLTGFRYPASFFQWLADASSFTLEDCSEDYQHPRQQRMVLLSRRDRSSET